MGRDREEMEKFRSIGFRGGGGQPCMSVRDMYYDRKIQNGKWTHGSEGQTVNNSTDT